MLLKKGTHFGYVFFFIASNMDHVFGSTSFKTLFSISYIYISRSINQKHAPFPIVIIKDMDIAKKLTTIQKQKEETPSPFFIHKNQIIAD